MTMDVSFTGAVSQTALKVEANNSATDTEPLSDSVSISDANNAEQGLLTQEAAKDEAEGLHDIASELTDMMSLMRKGLAFKVDEDSGRSVVSVMDVDSGDVIRQIPNEEALELAQKLNEVAGFLLKTEA
ncbi:flagellar protein FlaG [Shewanella sp. Isolate13]|uniref:flagellar protein FlaG n=1 Tax=Shewanella sp. Isolate13 TaxID=2908531 RepID=UPI001EFCCE95|nr:flagellar protein FlaG [Shewanella sp. Isolate13]MCG9729257.1 flagellar protein FlaG [Shewanella sp. Isolate13]